MLRNIIFQISFLLLFIFCQSSSATIKSFSVDSSTASRVDVTATSSTGSDGSSSTTNTYTVFGGYSGTIGDCSSASTSSVCNACTALTNSCGTYYSCAERSVNPSLILKMSFTVDQVPAGATVYARWENSSSGSPVTLNNSPTPTANTSIPVEIKWGELCNRASLSSTDCGYSSLTAGTPSLGFSNTLYVGLVDSSSNFISGSVQSVTVKFRIIKPDESSTMTTSCGSGQAFCAFKVVPGDQKVFVQNVSRGSSGPSDSSGVKWQSMRIFYKEISTKPTASTDFCNINLKAGNKDLTVTDKSNVETNIEPSKVTDLKNDQLYMFTVGTIDEATIVTGLMDTSDLFSSVDDHVAMPGEVVGLLDDKHCFIATAAYGSDMAPQVHLLRKFRNQFLIPHYLGRKFVKLYYTISPPLAQFISEHEQMRQVVRVGLRPLIWVSSWALENPLAFSAALFLIVSLILLSLLAKFRVFKKINIKLLSLIVLMGVLSVTFSARAEKGSLVDEETRQQEEYIRLKRQHEEEVSADPNQNRYPSPRNQQQSVEARPDNDKPVVNKKTNLVDEENRQQDEYIKLKKQDEEDVDSDPTNNRYPKKDPQFVKPPAPDQGGTLRVEHPDSKKGLLKIAPDGSYYYETAGKEKTQSVSVRAAIMSTPTIKNATGTATYDTMYGSSDLVGALIDYEWMPFRNFGSLGLKFETGFFTVSGKGFFKNKRSDGTVRAQESYTLYMAPESLFLNYRFEYWKGQLFVPFIYGGGTYYAMVEARDDGKSPHSAGAPAYGGGGGLMISLSRLDSIARYTMSAEYGVADMWLVVEGRAMVGAYEDLDFTNHFINVGVVVDF